MTDRGSVRSQSTVTIPAVTLPQASSVPLALHQRVSALLAAADEKWSLHGQLSITLDLSLRGRAAGKARRLKAGQYRISINPQMLEQDGRALDDVLVHEVAHCIVFHKWPRARPHGRRWKAVCLELGGSATTTHQLELKPARRSQRFRYLTSCGIECWLGPIQHRRASQGGIYTHRRSGQRLYFSGESRWQ